MTAGGSERVVLAPPERRPAILEAIRSARRNLWLSLYRCDDEAVLEGLAEACGRGVRVRVLVTSRIKGSRRALWRLCQTLSRTGAEVSVYPDPVVKYHAKYAVIDYRLAFVGTLNYTQKCFTRTCDALVVTEDSAIVASLARLFDADVVGKSLPGRLSPRLVVGPEQARARMRKLIEAAEARLVVVDPKLTDPEFVALFERRRAAGVEVVRYTDRRVGELVAHGKLLLIDGARAVVGSLSLAPVSLEMRRELALVVDDPRAVAQMEAFVANAARRAPTSGPGLPVAGGDR